MWVRGGLVRPLKTFRFLSGVFRHLQQISRPIGTPIKICVPPGKTCEQCHWPQKFVGNLDRTYNTSKTDASNSPYSIRLSIKIGGNDAAHGPVGGIHWHMRSTIR